MGIIGFLLLCAVVGFLCWLLTLPQVPLPPEFKRFIPFVAIALLILLLIWIVFGGAGHDVAIPRLR